ncbi:DUF6179 domain-containing protein [Oscillospiraceae bacterium MB08-C2-2]|nr:DUF6179 domain-containing protein [Oscillospiraceae bacterium MB08-C2-2]
MKNDLIPADSFSHQEPGNADILAAQIKLWEFLGRRVRSYTMGDSSSVRTETAQELLNSACYLLGIHLDGDPSALKAVLDWDLDIRFNDGIKTVEEKIKTAQDLWEAACISLPQLENLSLTSTLRSIGSFSRRYHYRYFAHEIPCDIDYQLCQPVPETLLGVDYILEYLRRIVIEQDFLSRLDPALCVGVLSAYCPDYRGLLINLYEPVATNAIGLALIGGDIHRLNVLPQERERMEALLRPLSKKQSVSSLRCAASGVCEALNIRQPAAQRYLKKLAEDLYPRIHAALSAGSLEGIF